MKEFMNKQHPIYHLLINHNLYAQTNTNFLTNYNAYMINAKSFTRVIQIFINIYESDSFSTLSEDNNVKLFKSYKILSFSTHMSNSYVDGVNKS